jgi:hypothetical protein
MVASARDSSDTRNIKDEGDKWNTRDRKEDRREETNQKRGKELQEKGGGNWEMMNVKGR